MMRIAYLIIMHILMDVTLLNAQVNSDNIPLSKQNGTVITGEILDSLKNPIPFAAVYLSHTTVGTSANNDGQFKITAPENGVYELVVTCIGYKSFKKSIEVEGVGLTFKITLLPNYKVLNDVVVTAKDKYRKRNLAMFRRIFLGTDYNSTFCEILNTEDLRLTYDKESDVLDGYSVKPLIIENKALGYMIKYDLVDFHYMQNSDKYQFSGNPFFMDLNGSPEEMKKWNNNRIYAYYGSRMHFLRALYNKKLFHEGFTIYEFKPVDLNQPFPNEKILNITDIRIAEDADNVAIYYPRKIEINFSRINNGLFAGSNDEYIVYSSRASFTRPINVYSNGFFQDGYSISWEGRMSDQRMANTLPYDYQPGKR
jgi:hypothetical protein